MMRKKDILLFLGVVGVIFVLIGRTIFIYKKADNNKDIDSGKQPNSLSISSKLYYELDDRYIYTHDLDNISFTYNNETKELKEWFKSDKNFLNEFLDELELKDTANDGGTNILLDGGTRLFNIDDIVVIVCKKITGFDGVYNNNIHIGKDLKYENDVCRMPIKSK